VEEQPVIEIPGLTFRDVIGRGANATVWLASDEDGDCVAVKVFSDPAVLAAAFDEAGALARLEHPNIINVRSVQRASGTVAVVMDLAAATVTGYLERHGPLRGAQVVSLVQDMCAGIEALHEHGMTHGDISPNNVGFTLDGVAQLLDFGAVRDAQVLGTDGFSNRVNSRSNSASKDSPKSVEDRMRRLLGARRVSEISLPTGAERARDDVLGAALVGLYALGEASDRGSVAATVAQVLERCVSRMRSDSGAHEITAAELARLVGEVIPPAPIVLPTAHDYPARSASPRAVEIPTTRRASAGDVVGGRLDDLWGDSGRVTRTGPSVSTKSQGRSTPGDRAPKTRNMLTAIAIAIGLAAVGGGIAIGLGENTSGAEAARAASSSEEVLGSEIPDSEPVSELETWQRTISELGAVRDAAMISGDPEGLVSVNAKNSPAQTKDETLLNELEERGLHLREFSTESTVLQVLMSDDENVRLLVETRVAKQHLEQVDGEFDIGAARADSEPDGARVELELIREEGQWRIFDVVVSESTG